MSGDYPPGVSGTRIDRGAFVHRNDDDHRPIYGYGWSELGGFFVENEPPPGVDGFNAPPDDECHCDPMTVQWMSVEAARCTEQIALHESHTDPDQVKHLHCGYWTEYVADFVTLPNGGMRTTWVCPEGHEFTTEDF
jgi:hypothetical protein